MTMLSRPKSGELAAKTIREMTYLFQKKVVTEQKKSLMKKWNRVVNIQSVLEYCVPYSIIYDMPIYPQFFEMRYKEW